MDAVLVKNDADDYELIEIHLDEKLQTLAYKGRIYEYCGTKDGRDFYTDL